MLNHEMIPGRGFILPKIICQPGICTSAFFMGYCTPNRYQALACFVPYLKIIHLYASYSKLSKELKNGIEILVGQAVHEVTDETVKMLFGSITPEPLGLPKF